MTNKVTKGAQIFGYLRATFKNITLLVKMTAVTYFYGHFLKIGLLFNSTSGHTAAAKELMKQGLQNFSLQLSTFSQYIMASVTRIGNFFAL